MVRQPLSLASKLQSKTPADKRPAGRRSEKKEFLSEFHKSKAIIASFCLQRQPFVQIIPISVQRHISSKKAIINEKIRKKKEKRLDYGKISEDITKISAKNR